jgi:biopolymer transport protein ExbB
MDRKGGLVFVVFFFCLCVWSAQADSAPVRQTIQEQSDQIRQDATATQTLLQEDQQDLQARLQELTKDVSGLRHSLEEKKQALDSLQKDENALKQQLKAERREVEEVQGSLVAAAKNMAQLLQRSPLGPLMPKQSKQMARVADRQDLPRMDEIRSVVNTSLEYMDRSAEIERFSGSFVDARGLEQTGTVIRIGGLAAMYHSDYGTGYLRPGAEGKELVAVGGDLPWLTKRNVRSYILGEADQVPLDISKGSVFAQISREQTWGEWLRSGGFLVWPLFCIAGLALILVGERLLFMFRIRSNSNRIMDQITELAQKNEWQKCREVCAANKRSPLCRVIGKGLNHVGESRQAVENALQEGLLSQLPRLERFLPTLNVLAAIAPLLGLLGTVTGMISTFQAITVFGTGEPKVMAGGISEALITTQIGLGVAVPIMFLHHLLDRRVDKIIGDIEEKGAAFSLLVMSRKRGEGRVERDDGSTEHAKTS